MALVIVLTLGVAPAPLAAQAQKTTLDPQLFPLPEPLEPNVDFWIDIFTRWSSHEVVLHDEVHLDRIYAVLDFGPLERSTVPAVEKERRRRDEIRKLTDKYRDLLTRLADGETLADGEESRRIAALLGPTGGNLNRYRLAADRLRTQRGLADQFAEAIPRAGRYLPLIEELFARRGLPRELTRLPFVESMFQTRAVSSAAAGGIWQLMPATGRRFLNIGSEADERYDPFLAAEAAARVLAENYKALQSWPLAITAYNHGKAGMMRAVKAVGSRDMGEIATRHSGRRFGFASRNFYSEFVAAVHVFENRGRYFPGIELDPPLAFDELEFDRYVPVSKLAEATSTSLEALEALNPALSREVWSGRLLVPRGYRLRVPPGSERAFRVAYDGLPDSAKPSRQRGTSHRVRRGDTLSGIAGRYGTTVGALQRANGLGRRHLIRIGQVLRIPAGDPWTDALPTVHVVRSGETLSAIARRYGTTVRALAAANGLASSHRIYIGQRLTIPGA